MIGQEEVPLNHKTPTTPAQDDCRDELRSCLPTFIAIALWTMILIAGLGCGQ
jgi:hypothetical protein